MGDFSRDDPARAQEGCFRRFQDRLARHAIHSVGHEREANLIVDRLVAQSLSQVERAVETRLQGSFDVACWRGFIGCRPQVEDPLGYPPRGIEVGYQSVPVVSLARV